ncbi:amino acid ABC transporter ATP-binding/permease protein [Alteromonas gracilis]|uniref:amino acid ABC transporter ATP-binding/permease protein n=1 Tax=Alteromonas gracilis TaxID=1479524 RepID=UPI002FE1325B
MKFWFSIIFKNERKRLLIGLFWSFFTMLSGVGLLALSGWLITATALAGIAIGAGLIVKLDMYMPGSGIRYFALSRTIGRYIERLYNHDTILRLIATYRVTIFNALSHRPLHDVRQTSDSEWLSRLTSDLDALDSILIRYTIPTLATGLLLGVVSVFLCFIWFEFGVVFLIASTLAWLLLILFSIRQTKSAASQAISHLNRTRETLISHLKGAFVLNSQHLMSHHSQDTSQALSLFERHHNNLQKRIARIQMITDSIFGIALVATLYASLWAVNHHVIEGPTAIMLALLFVGVAELLQTTPEQFSAWGKTDYASKRLSTLASESCDNDNTDITAVSEVSCAVSNHPHIPASASRKISFNVNDSPPLFITGRSGSGKSTLAKLIFKLVPLDKSNASVMINNISVQNISSDSLYRHCAYLEQTSSLLSGSLYYNLTLGLESIEDSRVFDVLSLVELQTWADSLPEGLNTWLGEGGAKVSGGQARRICLARLLLRSPELIVLDEPFNGLDSAMAERIFKRILPWLTARKSIVLLHEVPSFIEQQSNDYRSLNVDLSTA